MARSTFSGPITSQNGVRIGAAGTDIVRVVKGAITVDPANLAANTAAEETLTLTGAAVGDIVILQPPAAGINAGMLVCDVRVSAADEIKFRLLNSTGGAINVASADWNYLLIKF